MSYIEIAVPENYIFSTDIALHMSHINWGGHLDSAQLLVLVSEARERFFASMGYSQLNVEGLAVVMADAAQRYLSEAVYGDTMTVEVAVGEWYTKGFDFLWRMRNKARERDVAQGKSAMLFMDTDRGSTQPVPQAFRDKIQYSANKRNKIITI